MKTPEARSIATPIIQACSAAASGASPRLVAATYDGPMIKKTLPNVLGVSKPRGIAVTSDRPVRLASWIAMTV